MAGHISDMTAAAALTGDELVEVSQLSTTVDIAATTISALASDNSFNDSADGFVAAGFAVNDRVNVTGFTGDVANNLFVGVVTALTTGKMTIGGTDGDVIVDDAAGESVTITKWETHRTTAQDIADLTAGGVVGVDDEGSTVIAAASILNFVGAGVTVTDLGGGEAEIDIPGGGGGSGAWHLQGGPVDNEAPATNYATLDTRNSRPLLDYDTTTQEIGVWTRFLPPDYDNASGISFKAAVSLTSATSGTVGYDLALERVDASGLDTDTDSFGTATTITAVTVPGTSGQVLYLSVNVAHADMDGALAGELIRIRLRRDVANDTAAGDAEVVRWLMVQQ